MKKTNAPTALSAQADLLIDRALDQLAAGGFNFEIVDRCPSACDFCNDELVQAA